MKDKSEEILRIFNENPNLMYSFVKKYKKYLSTDDIYCCQLEGIYNALTNFNPEKSKFTTYLYRCINWLIIEVIRKEVKFKNLPKGLIREDFYLDDKVLADFFIDSEKYQMRDILEQRIIGKMSFDEIAKDKKLSRETIRKKFRSFMQKVPKKVYNIIEDMDIH